MTKNKRVKEKQEKQGPRVERMGLSLAEAGARVGVSRFTLRRMMTRGTLKGVRFGCRIVIPTAELERLLTMKEADRPAKLQRRAHVSASAPVEP